MARQAACMTWRCVVARPLIVQPPTCRQTRRARASRCLTAWLFGLAVVSISAPLPCRRRGERGRGSSGRRQGGTQGKHTCSVLVAGPGRQQQRLWGITCLPHDASGVLCSTCCTLWQAPKLHRLMHAPSTRRLHFIAAGVPGPGARTGHPAALPQPRAGGALPLLVLSRPGAHCLPMVWSLAVLYVRCRPIVWGSFGVGPCSPGRHFV